MTHKGENYSAKLQKYYFCNGTENLGKQSTTIDSSFMKIIDSQQREFSSDSKSWIYLKDNIFLKQVQPGLPTTVLH